MQLRNTVAKNQIDLRRKIKFKHSKVTFEGVPITTPLDDIAATFEVANALPNALTFISDSYEVEDLFAFYFEGRPNSIYKLTPTEENNAFAKFDHVMSRLPKGKLQHVFVNSTCLNTILDTVAQIRKKYKNIAVWVQTDESLGLHGNVAFVNELTLTGADVIKHVTTIPYIIKVRKLYDFGAHGADFQQMPLKNAHPEYRGTTDAEMFRTYNGVSLKLEENSIVDAYNRHVEEVRNTVYRTGCPDIETFSDNH